MHVRIYKASLAVTQSACQCARPWLIEPERISPEKAEPLMGWISAEDPFSAMKGRLRFDSLEKAQSFAHKQGWKVTTEHSNEKKFVPRNYLENFNADRRRDGR